MEEEKLTKENYHSPSQSMKYMGYSQYKSFKECEVKALAKVKGEYEEKSTEALLFGSYVDAYFSEELDQFIKAHPEMFNSKTGELKAPYKNVEKVIEAYENDDLMKKYWSGEHQVIMTGVINGVPVKIKMDSYFKDKAIVDGKVMRSFESVWVEKADSFGDVRNVKTDFVDAYEYDLEGAIYQEIEHQNSGKEKLPFILNAVTKEDTPDKLLMKIDQEYLDKKLEEFSKLAPRFQAIKEGRIVPIGCGKCDVCRGLKKISGVSSYKKLFHNDEI